MAKRLGTGLLKAQMQKIQDSIQMNQATLSGLATPTVLITGTGTTKVLTADDSGSVVIMKGADACTATLPALADGLNFTFYIASVFSHIVNGGAAKIQGCIHHNTAATTVGRIPLVNETTLTFSANPLIGDVIHVYCDGTNWYVEGLTNNAVAAV